MEIEKKITKSILNKINEIKNERLNTLKKLKKSISNNNLSEILDNAYEICGLQKSLLPLEHMVAYKQLKEYDLMIEHKNTKLYFAVKNYPLLTVNIEKENYE